MFSISFNFFSLVGFLNPSADVSGLGKGREGEKYSTCLDRDPESVEIQLHKGGGLNVLYVHRLGSASNFGVCRGRDH